jgi:hypothetical protein
MEHDAPAIFVALEQSGFAAAIRQSPWLYPAANVGHILALFCFAGAIAVMDLRLIGAFAASPPAAFISQARRFAAMAFVALAATGFMLFAAEASHLATNPVFQIKLVLIAAGLANILIFEFGAKRMLASLPAGAAMPLGARVAGVASFAIWLTVAACGRSIAYF